MNELFAHIDALDRAALQAGNVARDLAAASAPGAVSHVLPQARNFFDAQATAYSAHSAAISRLGNYFFAAQQGITDLSQQLLDHEATHAANFGG